MTDQRLAPEAIPAALEPILHQQIPGTAGGSIANWRKSESGFASDTYLFDVVGADRSAGEHFVFRRPPDPLLFPDYDLRRQYLTMQRLAGTGVQVPTLQWIDVADNPLGGQYYVMDRIEGGSSPSDLPAYHTAGVYFDADEAGREKYWHGCIDTIAQIHRLDWRSLRLDFLRYPQYGTEPVEQAVGYLTVAARWAAPTVPEGIARGLAWLSDNLYTPDHITLCWGDSRLSNLLYDNDISVIGVLDWECAYLGDHEADLAWLLFTDWLSSEFQGNQRLAGTPSRAAVIARYEQQSGMTVHRLKFNEILAAVLLAVPLIRMSAHLKIEGMPDLSIMCSTRIDQLLAE